MKRIPDSAHYHDLNLASSYRNNSVPPPLQRQNTVESFFVKTNEHLKQPTSEIKKNFELPSHIGQPIEPIYMYSFRILFVYEAN